MSLKSVRAGVTATNAVAGGMRKCHMRDGDGTGAEDTMKGIDNLSERRRDEGPVRAGFAPYVSRRSLSISTSPIDAPGMTHLTSP
jgi:hypothetical protein